MTYRGDIRHSYPPGTELHLILKFEIWDGERWVPSTEQPTYAIELRNSFVEKDTKR